MLTTADGLTPEAVARVNETIAWVKTRLPVQLQDAPSEFFDIVSALIIVREDEFEQAAREAMRRHLWEPKS